MNFRKAFGIHGMSRGIKTLRKLIIPDDHPIKIKIDGVLHEKLIDISGFEPKYVEAMKTLGIVTKTVHAVGDKVFAELTDLWMAIIDKLDDIEFEELFDKYIIPLFELLKLSKTQADIDRAMVEALDDFSNGVEIGG